jgi:hypothetical protein
MSALHAPRAPWLLLAVFCAAALIVFAVAIDRDVALIRDMASSPKTPAHVVRMPIVIEAKPTVRVEPPAEHARPTPTATHAAQPPAHSPSADKEAVKPSPTPAPPTPAPDEAGTLLSHQFKPADAGFEARFRTDKPVFGAKVVFRSAPAMWVVDLPGTWKNKARRDLAIDQGPIRRVAIGEHPKFLRIVLYYRDANHSKPSMTPMVLEAENGFTVLVPNP